MEIMITSGALLFLSLVGILKKRQRQKNCPHTSKHTYVESATLGCETVKITCLICDKVLSIKTDCR